MDAAAAPLSCEVLGTRQIPLRDRRAEPRVWDHEAPVVHVVEGMARHLPFLAAPDALPIICLSDWQWEKSTQAYFWNLALPVLQRECGGAARVRRALMLVAGDMASNHDWVRGRASDDWPDLRPFASALGPEGEFHFVYGNHDDVVPWDQEPCNVNHTPAILPDGEDVPLRWPGATEHVSVGGLHGVPGVPDGWKKRSRGNYFSSLQAVCRRADIVMLHCNPELPCQDLGESGQDARRIMEVFSRGKASKLLVHGHMHTDEVVSVLSNGKVVVNSDSRVVVLLPGSTESPTVAVPAALASPQPEEAEATNRGSRWRREATEGSAAATSEGRGEPATGAEPPEARRRGRWGRAG